MTSFNHELRNQRPNANIFPIVVAPNAGKTEYSQGGLAVANQNSLPETCFCAVTIFNSFDSLGNHMPNTFNLKYSGLKTFFFL
jgi:hypothetical protein